MVENGGNGGSFSVTTLFATFGWLEPEIGGVWERINIPERKDVPRVVNQKTHGLRTKNKEHVELFRAREIHGLSKSEAAFAADYRGNVC